MGSLDKGLQLLQGKPMVQWALERLQPQVDAILINANRNVERYGAFGIDIITDQYPDFAGPLAGLHAALSASTTPLVVTAPCDSPFLPGDLVVRLHAELSAQGADLAVARTFDRTHPVFCLCRQGLLPHLAAFLTSGQRKFGAWQSLLKVAEVSFDDCSANFENINTIDELARFDGAQPYSNSL